MGLENRQNLDDGKTREIQPFKVENTDNNQSKQRHMENGNQLEKNSDIGKKDETDPKKENLEQKEKGKEKREAVPEKDKELKQGQDVKNIENTGNHQDAGKNREQEHLKNGQKLDENLNIGRGNHRIDSSEQDKKKPVVKEDEPKHNIEKEKNDSLLPISSTRAPLRKDLPKEAYREGKIGDYPVLMPNWEEAFTDKKDAETPRILEPGEYYRYGGDDGFFITKRDPGQSLEDLYKGLALPYEYDPNNWSVIEVKKPIEGAHVGKVGEQKSFNEKGGGWQAELPQPIWTYPSDVLTSRSLRDDERY